MSDGKEYQPCSDCYGRFSAPKRYAVAHSPGGQYHIPHELANALLLPYVLGTVNSHDKPLALYIYAEDKKAIKEVTFRCHFGGG